MRNVHHRRKRYSSSPHNTDSIYIGFSIETDSNLPPDIDEAVLRLMIKSHTVALDNLKNSSIVFNNNLNNSNSEANNSSHHKDSRKSNSGLSNIPMAPPLAIYVYQLNQPYDRVLIDYRTVDADLVVGASHWIELDVTQAVQRCHKGTATNLSFEVECVGCEHYDMHIVHDLSEFADAPELNPMLNVVGRMFVHRQKRSRQQQHHHYLHTNNRKQRNRTDCTAENKKCCRHSLDIVFKEIPGFEFIIQPKQFDAGYCRGKCPPRYNPANHHAVLQSLLWKQDKSRVPRPCCAPSKLVELEILHVDETDPTKLKVSSWKDMRVLECACS